MAMTQVSLIAYLTAGAFLGMQYFDYFYNLVLIVVSARVILARHVAAKAEAQSGDFDRRPLSVPKHRENPPLVSATVALRDAWRIVR